jgi:hypothetical protein
MKYTYQSLYDIIKANGDLFQPSQVSLSATFEIDLTPYQNAVKSLDFKEFKDQRLESTINRTAANPSVDRLLGIDYKGVSTPTTDIGRGSAILNGDRIILNAKEDFAMMFGETGVAIASPNQVNIDAGQSITLFGHDKVYLGIPNKGLSYKLNEQQGESKGDPTPDQPYEPLVLGIKLANLIEDIFIVLKNAELVSGVSPVKFQPTTQAELALLANRIPEMLSSYAYLDGYSHERIDQNKLKQLKQSQQRADNFTPLTQLTGSVAGVVTAQTAGVGNISGDPVPITGEQKIQNIKAIAQYLKSIGVTREGAIGLIGNILGESQANPRAAERSSAIGGLGGIGIVQWTASRRRKLEAAAGNDVNKIFDINFQLQYLGKELQQSYSAVLNKLKTSKSIEESTVFVLERFEVPGTYLNRNSNPQAYEATKSKRIGYARGAISIVDTVYR